MARASDQSSHRATRAMAIRTTVSWERRPRAFSVPLVARALLARMEDTDGAEGDVDSTTIATAEAAVAPLRRTVATGATPRLDPRPRSARRGPDHGSHSAVQQLAVHDRETVPEA